MFPFRKTLGFRLLVISVILLALPLLVDSFLIVSKRYKNIITDAKNRLVDVANLRELPLAQIQPLSNNFLAVMEKFLGLDTTFPDFNDEKMNEELIEFAKFGDFFGVFIIKITEDNKFEVVSSNRKYFIGKDYTDFFNLIGLYSPEHFDESYESRISYDPLTLQPFFIVARPLFHEGNKDKPVGLLVVMDNANLTQKLEELLVPSKGGFPINFALLLPSSIVFTASDPSLQFHYFYPLSEEYRRIFLQQEPFAANLLPDHPIKIIEDKKESPFFTFEWAKDRQLGYIKHLPSADFSLLAYAAEEAIFLDLFVDYSDVYGIFGLILLIGTSLCYFLIRTMARPIAHLAHVMEKIQKGKIEERYRFDKWGFEINQLGAVFNEMLDSLIEKKQKAEEERVFKEGYARELKLGQQIQRSLLLEQIPFYRGVELAEVYIPAIEVGGDYLDVVVKQGKGTSEEKLYLGIADASGKGVQACFYSLGMRSLLRTFIKSYDTLDQAMHAANRLFYDDVGLSGMFITVLMAAYDRTTKELYYYSAGHNPPLVRRKEGLVEILQVQDVAMGLLETTDKKADKILLHEGDVLLFYTDGVSEAHNSQNELFGEGRLIEFLRTHGELEAKEMAASLVEELTLFAGSTPQHDDITLLIMKIRGETG